MSSNSLLKEVLEGVRLLRRPQVLIIDRLPRKKEGLT